MFWFWVPLVGVSESLPVQFPDLWLWWKILLWDLAIHTHTHPRTPAYTAWKLCSQHFISKWGQLSHTSYNGCTQIHKHSVTEEIKTAALSLPLYVSLFHTHTHADSYWHSLGLTNQSERSGVSPPRSGWESCCSCFRTHKVCVGGLQNFSAYYSFKTTFLFINLIYFFYWTLGSIRTELECGMAELVRIRKKRLQIPISR